MSHLIFTELNYSALRLYQSAVLNFSVKQYFYAHIYVARLLRVNYKNKPGLSCFHLYNACSILVFLKEQVLVSCYSVMKTPYRGVRRDW